MAEDHLYRIDLLLLKREKPRAWLAQQAGIPTGTMNGWWAKRRIPAADVIAKIARVLNTTSEYIMLGIEPDTYSISPGQRRLLKLFAGRSDQEIDEFIAVLESMRDYARKTPRFGR